MLTNVALAHPSPNTLGFLDISPGRVTLEVEIPITELELAFGQNLSKDSGFVIEKHEAQLKEYLLAHVHAYSKKEQPWAVAVGSLEMIRSHYPDSDIPFWELKAVMFLTPQTGDAETSHFFLDYDAVLHQVGNHAAIITVRSNWSSGQFENINSEANVIAWDLNRNVIAPLEINTDSGSKWKGFMGMLFLGMSHIKEGTDHLMFLITLLLPATLIVSKRRWGGFAGTKKSILGLLRIITAFTVGHSITLIIGATGLLTFPSLLVEIIIGISILVSAIHAIKPIFPGKETMVAAFFGLVHGMAFATTLTALHLSGSTMALSIFGFNVGIELMQIVIMTFILPWLIFLSKFNMYKWIRPIFASLAAIAAIGWIIERVTGNSNIVSSTVEKLVSYGYWNCLLLLILTIATIVSERKYRRSIYELRS